MLSRRLRVLLTLASSLALALSSSPASACWDGYMATFGKGTIYQAGPEDWDPALAREIATWARRIDASLPTDAQLMTEHGFVSLSQPGHDDARGQWRDGKMVSLYKLAARLSGRAARNDPPPELRPYTVQVFASHARAGADAFAASLDETLDARKDTNVDLVGFYDAGGYPARHALTHVVAEKDADGRTIYRVVVGAFIHAAEARDAFTAMHRETNVVGFVRPL